MCLCALQKLVIKSQVRPSFSDWLLLGQLRFAIEVNVRHCHQQTAVRRHSLSHCDHCQSFRDYLHICLNIIAREAYSRCTPHYLAQKMTGPIPAKVALFFQEPINSSKALVSGKIRSNSVFKLKSCMLVVWRYCAPPPHAPDQYYYKVGSMDSTDTTQGSPVTNRLAVGIKTRWQNRVAGRHRASPVTPSTHPPTILHKIPPSIQQLTSVITLNPLRPDIHISQPHCRIVMVWMYLGKCIRTCLYLLCMYIYMCVCVYK